eukprot:161023-Amphidinium_carterae.2
MHCPQLCYLAQCLEPNRTHQTHNDSRIWLVPSDQKQLIANAQSNIINGSKVRHHTTVQKAIFGSIVSVMVRCLNPWCAVVLIRHGDPRIKSREPNQPA